MMEIFAEKGVYRPEEAVTLTVRNDAVCRAVITVTSLAEVVGEYAFDCPAGKSSFTLPPFGCDFGGFGVLCRGGGEEARCAFDVQRQLRAFRYGFLSDFSPADGDDADVSAMAKHHINAVQFYDWSYRHDHLVAPCEEYRDMMGKRNSLPVIRSKIAACHAHGMKALGYGAVYAASEEFAAQHPLWRLTTGAGALQFIGVFSIMNLRSGWAEHIINEYCSAVRLGFDGIHMDTYGFPKTALDASGHVVHLEDDFPALIARTRSALPDATLVFNNVGAWPVEQTMHAPVDAVYIEVWPPYDRYHHLKELMLTAKRSGKSIVIAAYPAAFRTAAAEEALNSQLILSCVFAAHGATQLWFGEENAAVTQGYYADYSRLTPAQEAALRQYDDFFVRYEQLFFDDSLQDVSMTHFGWDNTEYRCSCPASVSGEPGKLWLILREKPGMKLVSVLNLCGESSDLWAEGHNECLPQKAVQLDVQVFGAVKRVLTASPDAAGGDLVRLPAALMQGERSPEVHLTLPELTRFAFILIETEEN